jgi:SAM-dependent methyltransferase
MPHEIDIKRAQAFARQVFGFYTGGIVSLLIHIGYKHGLFDAAAKGPATSAELAARAGLNERYVREWLGSLTTAGIFTHDAATGAFALPAEHAICLTGDNRLNVAPVSGFIPHLGKVVPRVMEAMRDGGGVPYSEFRPEFTELMDDAWRRIYDDALLGGFLPRVAGLTARLEAGARVADIGCGTGHAVNLMARAYPRSTFAGYEIAEDAIARARAEADAMGLANARFEVLDVTRLPAEPKLDVIFAFDTIHDQAHPAAVLKRAHDALAPDGLFVMVDVKGTSDVREDLKNPFAPFYYGVSLMHCMTVSLAEGGAGLGTMWGEKVARRMLAEAGFTGVEVIDAPRPQNVIYSARAKCAEGLN